MTTSRGGDGQSSVEVGTFIKTPSAHIVEILAVAGLDFAVLDAEHAPFDFGTLDAMLIAGKAAGLPLFVRVPDFQPSTLLRSLDLGAAGVLVPHVDTPEDARNVVARCRYKAGVRGYSGGSRSSGYGEKGMLAAVADAESVQIMCQIESIEAVDNTRAIAATQGVDGIFVGRADLALSMGLADSQHPDVLKATERAIAAGVSQGKRIGVVASSLEERKRYSDLGATWFLHGSDQSLLKQAARALVRA
ncbi:aldolase/citrate lyase family protein [Achromobacter veterisilvae]|uniref:5-keto-4-deoxy-D-glucarate aldolase n=1 Tax=Achromobacter veterisilvae TaxID=2069367 RepID=A0A446CKG2_9BURK|nr:aldolase/citrate lyase family protein [Achromobacter veterisilvae]SSW68253.1 5-keto-4-deoxy-D-glucarate aldolase [Achromobacter veterisilvae]